MESPVSPHAVEYVSVKEVVVQMSHMLKITSQSRCVQLLLVVGSCSSAPAGF